jgi:hypothetical protein
MSQRPRLAGDGRLRVPEKVALYWHEFMRGRLSERTIDPFDWTEDRLLLAESFARLDLDDRAAAKRWFLRHGVVDRVDFVGSYAELPRDDWFVDRRPTDLADHVNDIEAEQDNVSWHLATLERLSERRTTMDWDPDWGRMVIESPDGDLIVGGRNAGEERPALWHVDMLRRVFADDPDRQREADEDARLIAATADRPVVAVGDIGWIGWWRHLAGEHGMGVPEEASDKARTLGTTWDRTVELERMLIVPYVERAVERRFTTALQAQDVGDGTRSVLVPREERVWQSILAPIYLQLFEALRRITEGEPGAAICHECGRPFLVLDARRRFFCNERERFRHAKREQRKRLAVGGSVAPTGSVSTKVERRVRGP